MYVEIVIKTQLLGLEGFGKATFPNQLTPRLASGDYLRNISYEKVGEGCQGGAVS